MLLHITILIAFILVFAVLPSKAQKFSRSSEHNKVYPGETWQIRTPKEVGLSSDKLDAFRDFVGGRGCVARHGYMVYTWGDVGRRADVASAAKPVYAHFLFKALEDGKIPSLDEKVSNYEPRLNDLNENLDHKDRNITWRHLANQISCYGVAEKPSTAFDYNDWQMALFWDLLFMKVYATTYETVDEKVLHPLLTDQLQCEDSPTFMAFGVNDRPGRLAISVRDFARFGLLYLRKGSWNGKQLINSENATMAVAVRSSIPNSIKQTKGEEAEMLSDQRSIGSRNIPDNQTDHFGSYSWLWWTNGIDRDGKWHWPDAPADAYGAFGHGGLRAMVVIPCLDLIVSWNDTRINSREKENSALKLLVDAAVEPLICGKEIEMHLSEPIFLGFLPKKITARPDWLSQHHVKQICSVSDCISSRPPGMFGEEEWNYNRAGLFNNFDSAFSAIPADDKGKYEIFAYKAYPIQIDKDGVRKIDILKHLPGCGGEINPKPDLTGFYRIGYDLIQGIRGLSFGCSPLSCNSLAKHFKVNEFCLIDDLYDAIEAGVKFEIIGAEPPPYYLFEVYRKTAK